MPAALKKTHALVRVSASGGTTQQGAVGWCSGCVRCVSGPWDPLRDRGCVLMSRKDKRIDLEFLSVKVKRSVKVS